MTEKEESYFHDFAHQRFYYLLNHAFHEDYNEDATELTNLNNPFIKYVIFFEKELTRSKHKIGLACFLQKHDIQWGDSEKLQEIYNDYNQKLAMYKNSVTPLGN